MPRKYTILVTLFSRSHLMLPMAQHFLPSVTLIQHVTWHLIKDLEEMLALFWFGLHHSVRLFWGLYASAWPDNTLSLPRPFLDCHVWLTQSAATRMGVHPSLESPAVSGYIIAEPCWARWTALCACHWMWLWVRLSGGWEATVKGFLPGLQQRRQNKQNQRFWRVL